MWLIQDLILIFNIIFINLLIKEIIISTVDFNFRSELYLIFYVHVEGRKWKN
jgi:hypothetical protein